MTRTRETNKRSAGQRGRAGSAALVAMALATLAAPAAAQDAAEARWLANQAAVNAKEGNRRAAIRLYEQAQAADRARSFACEISEQYEALAAAGNPVEVELAALYAARCGWPEAKERVARMRKRLDPRRPTVPIRFVAYGARDVYDVQLGASRCTTPCSIDVQPGVVSLEATGPGTVSERLVIPDRPGEVALHHHDKRTLVTGAALVPTGVVMITTGPTLAFACHQSGLDARHRCQLANYVAWPAVGLGVLVTGISLVVASGWTPPFANRVVVGGRAEAPRLALTSVGVTPLPGGAGVGVGLAF